ncbi:MAG TPA: hypothetical protein DIW17_01890 [Clostridiales bacterium]|nr:hypothetical protein [Clostridiales bacterium]
MENEKSLNNFFLDSETDLEKKGGRRPPEIVKESREIKGNKDGKSLTIANSKAIELEIDGHVFSTNEFKKLFPNQYESFNIKRTYANKKLNDGIKLEESIYFYFPIGMLEQHSIKLTCRKKMVEITYLLS